MGIINRSASKGCIKPSQKIPNTDREWECLKGIINRTASQRPHKALPFDVAFFPLVAVGAHQVIATLSGTSFQNSGDRMIQGTYSLWTHPGTPYYPTGNGHKPNPSVLNIHA